MGLTEFVVLYVSHIMVQHSFYPFFFAKSCKYIKMILSKAENQIYPLNRHIYIVSGRLFKVLSFMGNPASFQKGY